MSLQEADSAFPEELHPIGRQQDLSLCSATSQSSPSRAAPQAAETAELVVRCLAGDEAAWRAFVERYEGAVFSLCFRMLRHRQDAEDVAQDTLVRAIRNLASWDQSRPILPWLMTIAANRCRTALGRRRRFPISTEFRVDPSDTSSSDSQGLDEEVNLALSELRDEYRECFILFYQQELSCAEISEVMGCPVGTVKTWLHRARHQMADSLRRRGGVAAEFSETRPQDRG